MKTNWKNVVYVEGYVYNFSLFKNVAGPNTKVPGQEYISGTVNIATDEDGLNIVSIRYGYVVPTYKKSGKENETYTILNSLIETKKTWENCGKENAVKLRIQGDIDVNDFMGRDGSMVESKQIRGGFTHYANDGFREKRNNFEADMLITSVSEVEVEDGDDYINLNGYVFNYRQDLIPVRFSLTDLNGIKYFQSLEYPYITYVWGQIISTTQKVAHEVESAWGAPQVEYTTRTLRQWQIAGCSPNNYPWDDESTITAAAFKEKLAAREQQKAEAKARAEEHQKSSSGIANGFPVTNNNEVRSTNVSPTSASDFKF